MTDRDVEKCKKQLEAMRKLPENRRCANCASMAVPYICLDFGTFVCTRCSALHRDLTHRVKSITASKFTALEVAGVLGNQNDAQLYLCNWNESYYKVPGAGNEDTERAREFMNIKYVEKRWAHDSIKPAAPVAQQQFQQPAQPVYQQPTQPIQNMQQPMQPVTQYQQPQPAYGQQFGGPAPTQPFGQPPAFANKNVSPVKNAPAPVPVQAPVEDDPFADMLGPGPVKTAQPVAQPVVNNQPNNNFNQPTFNAHPNAPTNQPNQGGFAQPTFNSNATFNPNPQPTFNAGQSAAINNVKAGFNAAAFVGNNNAGNQNSAQKANWDMFGDMVKKAAGPVAAANQPIQNKPQPVKVNAPAPAPKGNDLLDF
ncbi:Putative_GTPase activating protein for ARF [Hexamita inflata]|uniref:GTPase activating protein for ARF n=1 Tax=Hexamita inflata TaxID=28002 RepID=A0AA86TRR4_9EUKA|nr:Putative GTPase activating protein for ARF [Hexamita inflata]